MVVRSLILHKRATQRIALATSKHLWTKLKDKRANLPLFYFFVSIAFKYIQFRKFLTTHTSILASRVTHVTTFFLTTIIFQLVEGSVYRNLQFRNPQMKIGSFTAQLSTILHLYLPTVVAKLYYHKQNNILVNSYVNCHIFNRSLL